MNTETEYIPYGPEWEKEMNKFPKAMLIKQLAKAHLKRQEVEECLENYAKVMEQFTSSMPDEYAVDLIAAAVVRSAHEKAVKILKP